MPTSEVPVMFFREVKHGGVQVNYKQGTSNLFIYGMCGKKCDIKENWGIRTLVEKVEEGGFVINDHGIVMEYEQLLKLPTFSSIQKQIVYIACVDDLYGKKLKELVKKEREKLRSYFTPFDNVDGLFWKGSESDGFMIQMKIKENGKYVGIFGA